MKYYIIAGEASGDLHASHMAESLNRLDPNPVIYAWGGELLKSKGVNLRKHYKDTAYMGFVEVLKNLSTIKAHFSFCKNDILEFNPDVLILVDYPGFNLRMAKWANKKGIKVAYYISPQVWAWKTHRVEIIRKYVNKMIVILPFEKDFYKQRNVEVNYVGHPLLDELANFKKDSEFPIKNQSKNKIILALLPGSRKQEVERVLPRMLEAALKIEHADIAVAVAPSLSDKLYENIIEFQTNKKIHLIKNKVYQLLSRADFAFVTSGTATLETALFKVPQIVCYVSDPISIWIARKLIHVKYISLVNLIIDREIIPELIQSECTAEEILSHFNRFQKQDVKAELIKNYNLIETKLGGPGASEKTAQIIYKLAKK